MFGFKVVMFRVEMYGKRNISRNTRCDYEERTMITQFIKNKMI